MINAPWLTALNPNKKVEPEVALDEHVEALPVYATPPPLEEVLAKPITMLPFPFDAADVEPWPGEELDERVKLNQTFDKLGPRSELYSNAMPFMPNTEALLPEPAIGLDGREEPNKEWANSLVPTESVAYDNHINLLMGVNPMHSAHLARLKGYYSKYLKLNITQPNQAEEHIRQAKLKGEEPGGWDSDDHQHIRKAQGLIAKGIADKAKAEQRLRWQAYKEGLRQAWKQAVADRASALEIWNTDVSNKHQAYADSKGMTFNEYIAKVES